MLEIHRSREVRGSVDLPSATGPYILSAFLATRCPEGIEVSPVPESPELNRWNELLGTVLEVQRKEQTVFLRPREAAEKATIRFADDHIPYRDFCFFLLVGQGIRVEFQGLSEERVQNWQEKAALLRCELEIERTENSVCLSVKAADRQREPRGPIEPETIYSVLGLALGLGRRISFEVEYGFASPLRHVLPALGYELQIRQQGVQHENDPLQKRMRFLAKKKKTEESVSYMLNADFRRPPSEVKTVSLPGDPSLASLLFAAKALVQRGALVINNVPIESWATSTLDLIRKMGCKPAIQETGTTSFGAVGMVQLQHFQLATRKTNCRPISHFVDQLPAMMIIAAFTQGQSVFRGLEDLRRDIPSTFDQLALILERTGTRHGEMPDGLVVDGSKEGDGFDLNEELSASINGACAICGLKCRGTTTIATGKLYDRWPDFEKMLKSLRE